MSFEGYYQLLCEKGHETQESLELTGHTTKCDICGGEIIYHGLVDCTNGPDEGLIKFVQITPPERTVETLPDGRVKRVWISGKYALPKGVKPRKFPF